MKKALAFLLLACSCFGYSQEENPTVDSLKAVLARQKESIEKCRTLNELSDTFYRLDPDQGVKYADQALKLSTKLGYEEGIAFAKLHKGENLWLLGENDKALRLYSEARALFEKGNDNCSVGLTLLNTGTVYGRNGKFPEGLEAFLSAIRMLEKCKDSDSAAYLASCYQNIGNIYNATEQYQKALTYYDLAIKLYGKVGDEVSIAMNMGSKGMILNKLERNKEGLATFKEAEKKLVALQEEVPLAYVRSWMGTVYIDLQQYDESIRTSENAYATISKIGDEDLMASTIQNIGTAYLQKGIRSNNPKDLAQAKENLEKALEMHLSQGNHERITQDYLHLSTYYRHVNDFENSLSAHMEAAVYNDSMVNFKNKQSLQNLEDERTIELRDKQLQLNNVQLEAREKQKWYFISGILLLLVIAGLVFIQSQNRKNNNRKLQLLNAELDQANQTKARFFSILNHDLRSPVSNLIHFLHLQKESPELLDAESKNRMENKTIASAENLLGSMEDILLWSKGQMENFKPEFRIVTVEALFEGIKRHFSTHDNTIILFRNPENISFSTDPNYLETIMRNLTGNALKALESTPNAAITWMAFSDNGKYYLSVSDNGNGGTAEQFKALYDDTEVVGIKTGLGLHLIRDLAKAIHCKIEVDTRPGEGTTFKLSL